VNRPVELADALPPRGEDIPPDEQRISLLDQTSFDASQLTNHRGPYSPRSDASDIAKEPSTVNFNTRKAAHIFFFRVP
jgi:hypothetical protein